MLPGLTMVWVDGHYSYYSLLVLEYKKREILGGKLSTPSKCILPYRSCHRWIFDVFLPNILSFQPLREASRERSGGIPGMANRTLPFSLGAYVALLETFEP